MVLITSDDEYQYEEAQEPMSLTIVTAHQMWAQMLEESLKSFSRKIVVTTTIVTDHQLNVEVGLSPEKSSQVVLVTSSGFLGSELSFVKALRESGYKSPVLILCSHFALPTLEDLTRYDVGGVVVTSASLPGLEEALYVVADGKKDALKQQYLRATRLLTRQPLLSGKLTDHEIEILKLVAADLTDQQIADKLRVSVKTVNNQLRLIYAKLGVTGRAGAVGTAFSSGTLTPHLLLSVKDDLLGSNYYNDLSGSNYYR